MSAWVSVGNLQRVNGEVCRVPPVLCTLIDVLPSSVYVALRTYRTVSFSFSLGRVLALRLSRSFPSISFFPCSLLVFPCGSLASSSALPSLSSSFFRASLALSLVLIASSSFVLCEGRGRRFAHSGRIRAVSPGGPTKARGFDALSCVFLSSSQWERPDDDAAGGGGESHAPERERAADAGRGG